MLRQQQNSTTRGADALLFARNFFRYPRMLGSVLPSSRFLIKKLLKEIDWTHARVIVEYGPGLGGITAEVLRHMRPDAILIAIETNSQFVARLRSSHDDHRLRLVEASAESVLEVLQHHGHGTADYIISGIPFSTMPAAVRDQILRDTFAALEPGGSFLVYQFSSQLRGDLQRIFGYVRRKFEVFNILPAHLFFCRRTAITG